MNYYPHHIGDYDSRTAHLSWLEDLAYRRLICLYYRNESPLSDDVTAVARLIRATSKAERDAVASVLNEFFVKSPDGWRHVRCDEEIGIAETKRNAARNNGTKGGRPQKPSGNPAETQLVNSGLANGNPEVTQAKALQSQSPIPIPDRPHKAPREGRRKTRIPDDFILTDDLRSYAETQLPLADVAELFAKYREQALAGGWEYANWPAAFQTYCRNAKPDSGHFSAGQYPRKGSGGMHAGVRFS